MHKWLIGKGKEFLGIEKEEEKSHLYSLAYIEELVEYFYWEDPAYFSHFKEVDNAGASEDIVLFMIQPNEVEKIDSIPLATLKQSHLYGRTASNRMVERWFEGIWYEASLKEYRDVFGEDSLEKLVNDRLRPLYHLIRSDTSGLYDGLLSSFQFSLLAIHNDLAEFKKSGEEYPEELRGVTYEILIRLADCIDGLRNQVETFEKNMEKAELHSRRRYLEDELAHVKRFITFEETDDEQPSR